jgi:RHS repeat-associated protein
MSVGMPSALDRPARQRAIATGRKTRLVMLALLMTALTGSVGHQAAAATPTRPRQPGGGAILSPGRPSAPQAAKNVQRALKPGSMQTDGAMNVRADGTAAYAVPIEEPPGTAGMAPQLAFTYSSGGGDGILGIGWSLTGLPSVTRCTETQAQDGQTIGVTFTGTDRFCFAGQRLVAVSGTYGASGTTYRTEIDSFSLITSSGGSTSTGPQYFTVQTKSGETLEFGNSSTSFIQAIGPNTGSSTARAWALDKVSDHAGNYYTVTYSTENTATGEIHPVEIDYTGNTGASQSPYNAVKFIYGQNRSFNQIEHLAGTVNETTVLLSEVQTILQNSSTPQLVHDYFLTYGTGSTGRPQLTSVQHCDGGSPQSCLPATSFTYSSASVPTSLTAGPSCTSGTPAGGAAMTNWVPYVADLNNDGRDDLFWVQETPPTTGTTVTPAVPTGQYQIWYSLGNGGFNCVTPSFSQSSGGIQGFPSFGDFGGTGRTDILLTGAGSNSNSLTLLTNTNDSGTFAVATSIPFSTIDPTGAINVADFEGKGRTSVVLQNLNTGGSIASGYVILTNSGDGHDDFTITAPASNGLSAVSGSTNGFLAYTADFNGDGKADLLFDPINPTTGNSTGGQRMIGFSTGDFARGTGSFTLQPISLPSGVTLPAGVITVADINGDGIADLILNPTTTSSTGTVFTTGALQIYLGHGDGSFDAPVALNTGISQSQVLIGNFSGSGYADVLVSMVAGATGNLSAPTLYLGHGDGSFAAAQALPCLVISGECAFTTPLFADFVGVGLNSLLQDEGAFGSATTAAGRFGLLLANPTQPDLLTQATNGLGMTTTMSYAPISQGAPLYVKDPVGTVSYPTVSLQTPMPVVSQVQTSDGIGGVRSMSYSYGSLRADLSGRGSLGFGGYNTADAQTGIGVEMAYDQVFPLAGLPGQVVTVASENGSSVTLSTSTITYDQQVEQAATSVADLPGSPGTVGAPGVTFAAASASSTTRNDLNGAALPSIATSMSYDCDSSPSSCFGNMASKTVTVTGTSGSTDQTVTSMTYESPDTKNWLVGEVATVSVTDTPPNQASATRSSSFTYESGTGLLASATSEPGASFSNAAGQSEQLQIATDYGYDGFGNPTTIELVPSDVASRTTVLSWATPSANLNTGVQFNQFPQVVTDPLGHVAHLGYDTRFGAVGTGEDINNLETVTSYDTFGRPTQTLRPDGTGSSISYGYCSAVQSGGASCVSLGAYQMIVTPIDSNGNTVGPTTTMTSDALGRVIAMDMVGFDGSSTIRVSTSYDTLGRVTQVTEPYFTSAGAGASTQFQYDVLGRVTQQTAPDDGVTTHSYNGLAQTDTLPTGTGAFAGTESFTTTRTPLGQTASATDPIGNVTSYAYFAFGSLASVTDAAGNVVSYSYDPLGRMTGLIDPDAGTRSATYYSTGELASATEPGGTSSAAALSTSYTYDALGRLTSRAEPDLNSCWSYDPMGALGRLASAATGPNCSSSSTNAAGLPGGMSYSYSYDSLTRPSGTVLQFGSLAALGFSNAYVPVGAKGSPNAGEGQLASMADGTSGSVELYAYTSQGYFKGLSRSTVSGSASVSVYQILGEDASLRPLSVSYGTAAFTNSIPSGTTATVTDSYAYDQLFYLRQAANAATSKTYAYDEKTGNLTGKSDTGTYTYPAAGSAGPHQLQSIAGTGSEPLTASYSYDPRGNMLSGDDTASYSWTSFNQPSKITKDGSTVQYYYDVNHNRIAVQTTLGGGTAQTKLYLREASGSFAEAIVGSSGTVSTLLDYFAVGGSDAGMLNTPISSGTPSTATMRYLRADPRGSVYAISDDTGAADELDSYDPWGKRRATSGADDPGNMITSDSAYGYIDEEQIAGIVDLINLNARLYNRHTGRFLSPDPLGLGGGKNVYAYANDNPTSVSDRSGLDGGCVQAPGSSSEVCTVTPNAGPPTIDPNQLQDILNAANMGLANLGQRFGEIVVNLRQQVTARITTRTSYIVSVSGVPVSNTGSTPATGGTTTDGLSAGAINIGQDDGGGFQLASYTMGDGATQFIDSCAVGQECDTTLNPENITVTGARNLYGNDIDPGPSFQVFLNAANDSYIAYKPSALTFIFPFSLIRGFFLHREFASIVRAAGPMYSAEVSYKGGVLVPYGTPGSVRADGVYGPITNPIYAVELKSGLSFPTSSEISAYQYNLPPGTGLFGIAEELGR